MTRRLKAALVAILIAVVLGTAVPAMADDGSYFAAMCAAVAGTPLWDFLGCATPNGGPQVG